MASTRLNEESDKSRLREARYINKSLSALGDVVSALLNVQAAGGKTNSVHIPYRNSKLTFVLQVQ